MYMYLYVHVYGPINQKKLVNFIFLNLAYLLYFLSIYLASVNT